MDSSENGNHLHQRLVPENWWKTCEETYQTMQAVQIWRELSRMGNASNGLCKKL